MIEGHRWTGMPWSLNPRDVVTMTGSAALSFERTGVSRLGLGLHQSDWPGSTQADETSSFVFGDIWQRIPSRTDRRVGRQHRY